MSRASEYCVDRKRQPNGEHIVHTLAHECPTLPDPQDRVLLGFHLDCFSAMAAARLRFSSIEGCETCSSDCSYRKHFQ